MKGKITKTGYKKNSPDVNNDYNIIPSGRITMRDVQFPVYGVDEYGNAQMMYPGGEYQFPGSTVFELPMAQLGGMRRRKIDRILNENRDLNFVQRMYQPGTPSIMIPGQDGPSTHFMESADGFVYPTVVQMPDGNLQYLGEDAYDHAMQTGEYIQFPNDRQARRFAKSYKKGTGVLEEYGKGGLTQWFDEKWVDVKTGKECGRSGKDKNGRPYPACRPSKRVNETTPKTTSEMSSSEKAKFKREKTSGKRINYNHKRAQEGGQPVSLSWNDPEYRDYYNRLDKDVVIADPSNETAGVTYLDEVEVYPDKRSLEPYWDILTEEEKRFWNDDSPIGRSVRSIAKNGRTNLSDELGYIGKTFLLDFLPEITGIPGVYRFSQDPIGNLQGAGHVIEDYMLGTNPMASSFLNTESTPEEKQQFWNTFDAVVLGAPVVGATAKTASVPVRIAANNIKQGARALPRYVNPNYFKPNSNMLYRGIGREGMEDALQYGAFRAKPNHMIPARNVDLGSLGSVDMAKRFNKTYYSPQFSVADRYGAGYIAEVPRDAATFSRRYKGSDWSMMTRNEIPVSEGRILQKDYWRGYKPVDASKATLRLEQTPPIKSSQYIARQYTPHETALLSEYGKGMGLTPEQWAEMEKLRRSGATQFKGDFPISRVLEYYTGPTAESAAIKNLKVGETFHIPTDKTIRTWSAGLPSAQGLPPNPTRLVIPSKYTQDLGDYFVAMNYADRNNSFIWNIGDDGMRTLNIPAVGEKELIGNVPNGFKVLGRTNEGGFDNIFIKPFQHGGSLPGYKPINNLQKGGQKREPTDWVDYLNPMNWFVTNRDQDGDFKQAFRAARNAGDDEFMWYGTRYTTDYAPQSDIKTVPVKKKEVAPAEIDLDFDTLKRGVSFVESRNGKYMWNPESSATGLYGQRFSEIQDTDVYSGTRENFRDDLDAQNRIFELRFNGELPGSTTGLKKDALDLYKEYYPIVKKNNISPVEIAALSNFLGRQGTRYYLGYVLRDGRSLEDVFPNLYGSEAGQSNKTPDQYLELFREAAYAEEQKVGGEIEKHPDYSDHSSYVNAWKAARRQLGAGKKFKYGGRVMSTSTPNGH